MPSFSPFVAPPISALRSSYAAQKAALQNLLPTRLNAQAKRITEYLQGLAAHADQTLAALWEHFPALHKHACLCAVGGYGRNELFPHSDVDVLLLLHEEANDICKRAAADYLSACWDIGLEIAASVRTVAECCSEAARDITIQTSLLEARYVLGDRTLWQTFETQYPKTLEPLSFFNAKTIEMRQRHEKYKNTPYELEPNCKESPGGLRDLHILLWVAKAAGWAQDWDGFARCALATSLEVAQLKKNWAILATIRAHLHLLAGRREDRLVFDWQTPLAQILGYGAQRTDPTRKQRRASRQSEALMRQYYWAAKAVTQLNQIILLNAQEGLQKNIDPITATAINARFYDRGGLIDIADEDLYEREPRAILETFYLFQTTHGVHGLSAKTLRALYNTRSVMDANFRRDSANRVMFMQILKAASGITHVLRLMNQTSVLGRYLWVFRRIVGQMQHDLFHVYTVDQHILMVVRNVRRFFIAEHAHEYPFCSELAAGWDQPWVLYVAALFHDIAKGRGGDHSELGTAEVRIFCQNHAVAQADTDLIAFLVQEHLTMSTVAQKKDLTDPQVIADFAAKVGSERYLTGLYLLTVADIRGTSPRVWTAWKGKLLEDLYRRTLRVLGGTAVDPKAELENRKKLAQDELALHGLPEAIQEQLWANLDVSYFMRHEPSEIAWHTRMLFKLLRQSQALLALGDMAPATGSSTEFFDIAANLQRAFVFARQSPVGDGLQVMVCAPDARDLFARICAWFDRAGFSIVDAKIYTAPKGWVLDTFELTTTTMPEHYRELLTMTEVQLAQALNQSHPLPATIKGRTSRRVRHFPMQPHVDLHSDEKGENWLLTVACADRLGLLYAIARTLAAFEINLQSAKIVTLGERVEDTFLINGKYLAEDQQRLKLETALLAALAQQ